MSNKELVKRTCKYPLQVVNNELLTNTSIDDSTPDGAFEEAGTAVTAEGAIVLPVGLVRANSYSR
jgi:hypothetical protein